MNEISRNSANYLMSTCNFSMDFEPESKPFPEEFVLAVDGLIRVRFRRNRPIPARHICDILCDMSADAHFEMEELA